MAGKVPISSAGKAIRAPLTVEGGVYHGSKAFTSTTDTACPCICGEAELWLQARHCGTGALINLYAAVGEYVNAFSWDDVGTASVVEQIGSGILAFDANGRLYVDVGSESRVCVYFDLADQLPFSAIPALAHWVDALQWPYNYSTFFPCDTCPQGRYLPYFGVIHPDCTSGFVDENGIAAPNIPCDQDNDGVVDPPPPDPIDLPDDPGTGLPPGIDNGNCPGMRFYNMVVVYFRDLIPLECAFLNLAVRDFEVQGVGDGIICPIYDPLFPEWFGTRLVRYRICTPSVVDPDIPCIDCMPSDTGWATGRLEVTVTANFRNPTPPGPSGWTVSATLYTESHGFIGEIFAGQSPPLGDCASVIGIPSNYTTSSPGVTIYTWGGFADVFSANGALPP